MQLHNNNRIFKFLALSALSACIFLSAVPQSNAQMPFQKPIRNCKRPENASKKLNDFVDMPNLPRYTGKTKFLEGALFEHAQSGPSITVKFLAEDKPAEILRWYQNALEQQKWSMEKGATTDKRLGATREKNICRILVVKNPGVRFKSHVTIKFRIGQTMV